MKFKPGQKDELTELLGTKERAQQVEIVRRLLGAPVVEMIIRLDARSNQVSYNILGGQIAPAIAYQMLDACRDLIRQQELAAAAANAKQNGHVEGPGMPAEVEGGE
jgi:hypothetical protein